ncbi:nucleotidyltransferase [Halalkalibacter urbisdiaboli]|uniref:nucleotidyltransferase n=1 Tax=Halalkalibacter urbisdiaboli TaxID=1960589 RepID=UPI000B431354|nr:nucleotidyltransferase [Halalkalibacter urbisdiaboli]
MKTVGIVVEYNPLHNGHLYHIKQARLKTNADVVIAVMSGSFLQRGEPAFVSKWQRTRMALEAGIDLVLELPYIYSTQKAETFAEGAMKVLATVGVQTINFGSESGSIKAFEDLLNFMEQHHAEWNKQVKINLKNGVSYPRATSEAFSTLSAPETMLSLSEPNNILGYHYMKAIRDMQLSINATTITRKSAHYHEETVPASPIASATSIRKKLNEHGALDQVKHVLPSSTFKLLQEYVLENKMFHTWEAYFPLLQYQILCSSLTDLRQIYEAEEGLEYRVKETIKKASSFSEWMNLLKTKRYTRNRLQRYATHILTQTTKEDIMELTSQPTLPYIRLLGMSSLGQTYLNKIKKDIDVPLISRAAQAYGLLSVIDERVTNIYYSPLSTRLNRMKEEFTIPPLRPY